MARLSESVLRPKLPPTYYRPQAMGWQKEPMCFAGRFLPRMVTLHGVKSLSRCNNEKAFQEGSAELRIPSATFGTTMGRARFPWEECSKSESSRLAEARQPLSIEALPSPFLL